MPLAGRAVLVTGAASGLGAALVAAHRARGDEVLATDRVAAPGIDLVLDITSDDDCRPAYRATASRFCRPLGMMTEPPYDPTNRASK